MDNLISQGFQLALFGMGTVFIFLTMLIFATKVMSAIALRFEVESDKSAVLAPAQSELAENELVAVISAAIRQFRSSRK